MILPAFNASMTFAHVELRLASLTRSPSLRSDCYANASDHVRTALANANAMKDRARIGLCLKALHWIRLSAARS